MFSFFNLPANGVLGKGFRVPCADAGETYEHGGQDILCEPRTPVYAPAGGQAVAFPGGGWKLGRWVLIDHGHELFLAPPGLGEGTMATRIFSAYGHLSELAFDSQLVQAGDLLGYTGTEPLHWAMSTNRFFTRDFTQLCDPLAHVGVAA